MRTFLKLTKSLQRCCKAWLVPFTVGEAEPTSGFLSSAQTESGQLLTLEMADGVHEVPLPLVGEFQASNAVVAAGLVIATGGELRWCGMRLLHLNGATGRLELVGKQKMVRVFMLTMRIRRMRLKQR